MCIFWLTVVVEASKAMQNVFHRTCSSQLQKYNMSCPRHHLAQERNDVAMVQRAQQSCFSARARFLSTVPDCSLHRFSGACSLNKNFKHSSKPTSTENAHESIVFRKLVSLKVENSKNKNVLRLRDELINVIFFLK